MKIFLLTRSPLDHLLNTPISLQVISIKESSQPGAKTSVEVGRLGLTITKLYRNCIYEAHSNFKLLKVDVQVFEKPEVGAERLLVRSFFPGHFSSFRPFKCHLTLLGSCPHRHQDRSCASVWVL